ncbi:unnamed protein product [Dibothriocephalus latus]|uniref:Uncharacterized protein n=1 Tax=Dibothriocephalus latus TaxID=60516 RepID=A0A3P6PGN6_DIBLA|nr:unnamed protein product [Dibothriocephalus latus]
MAACPSVCTPLTSSPKAYNVTQAEAVAPEISTIDLHDSFPSTVLEVSTDDQSTLALEESETTQPANDSNFDSFKNVSLDEDRTTAEDERGRTYKETELTEFVGEEPGSDCPPDSSFLLSAPYPEVNGSSSVVDDLPTSPARDSIAT